LVFPKHLCVDKKPGKRLTQENWTEQRSPREYGSGVAPAASGSIGGNHKR
jgi:hypothetical protein